MLNLRYIVRLTSAFVKKFKGILMVGAIIGISLFFIAKYILPGFLGSSHEKIGITGRYDVNNLPEEIQKLIGSGLTTINSEGIVEPGLAHSWETTDKGKTWVFHLRDDIYWQDGKKITSESIDYKFSDVEIERKDDKSIVFKLKDPFSPFPVVVSKTLFKKGLLSNGEWEVDKVVVSGNIVQSISLKNKLGSRKTYKFYPTEERTKLAFKLGVVDIIPNIYNPTPLDEWKTNLVETSPNKNQIVTIFFNTTDPLLSEKTFRQALNYAIDKNSGNLRAISPYSPNLWAYNPQVKEYDYSEERAISLLGEIEGEGFEIKLATTPTLLPLAESIASDWEKIGIKTHVQVSAVRPIDFQTYLAILDVPKDPDQYSLWHSTQISTNISLFNNPRIDKLLEDGRTELDFESRKKIYLDFQRFLAEELPAIFLHHPTSSSILRK